jgi:hypothetical protein
VYAACVDVSTLTSASGNTLLRGVRETLDAADDALLCVAFVQRAGVHLLRNQLERLGPRARVLLTTTFTQCRAALGMAEALGASVSVLNPSSGTYHPKIYAARTATDARVVIGSANMTGGLVNNVEAAVLMRGSMGDEPIRTAWEFAESLWNHARRVPWTSVADVEAEETFAPDLYAQLVAVTEAHHGVFYTLGPVGKANLIREVTPAGLYVETEASRAKGNPPQLIPAWMFTLAWDYLRTHGRLSNRYLLASDGLNVKRSSAVCAVLARLPGVQHSPTTGDGTMLSRTDG